MPARVREHFLFARNAQVYPRMRFRYRGIEYIVTGMRFDGSYRDVIAVQAATPLPDTPDRDHHCRPHPDYGSHRVRLREPTAEEVARAASRLGLTGHEAQQPDDHEERRRLLEQTRRLRENIPEPVAGALDAIAERNVAEHTQDTAGYHETASDITPFTSTPPSDAFQAFQRYALRRAIRDGHLREPWTDGDGNPLRWDQRRDATPAPSEAAPFARTLSQDERRFMLRHCGRMEAELRQIVATNPTVRSCWDEAQRGGLSETSAAELAVIALVRETDDLKRALLQSHRERLPVVSVVEED